tara:strand:- start:205 stop:498 length:294 start_codon:yes stop_codon:yes gene_type:complete
MAKKEKKEQIIDLKPKAEKITEEELKKLQETVGNINRHQMELGIMETRKHHILHDIAGINDQLRAMQEDFTEKYGTTDINIENGEIKYSDEQTNKKD